jgi:hypothetical protein
MADGSLDNVRAELAELSLLEDAALMATVRQGVRSLDDGRNQSSLLSIAMHRIGRHLSRLERQFR